MGTYDILNKASMCLYHRDYDYELAYNWSLRFQTRFRSMGPFLFLKNSKESLQVAYAELVIIYAKTENEAKGLKQKQQKSSKSLPKLTDLRIQYQTRAERSICLWTGSQCRRRKRKILEIGDNDRGLCQWRQSYAEEHTNAEQNEINGSSLRRTTPAAVAMSRRRTP
ncbi:uncharacterized protein G2W53_041641 [Senna tora]|uniref:Uncharacterized protein n=1 Tax=Senna tora TaxID=362788 RepID=A0A834SHC6_9FABA|nr:uncharacterized protein G2W53_041641 [Senna tora]